MANYMKTLNNPYAPETSSSLIERVNYHLQQHINSQDYNKTTSKTNTSPNCPKSMSHSSNTSRECLDKIKLLEEQNLMYQQEIVKLAKITETLVQENNSLRESRKKEWLEWEAVAKKFKGCGEKNISLSAENKNFSHQVSCLLEKLASLETHAQVLMSERQISKKQISKVQEQESSFRYELEKSRSRVKSLNEENSMLNKRLEEGIQENVHLQSQLISLKESTKHAMSQNQILRERAESAEKELKTLFQDSYTNSERQAKLLREWEIKCIDSQSKCESLAAELFKIKRSPHIS